MNPVMVIYEETFLPNETKRRDIFISDSLEIAKEVILNWNLLKEDFIQYCANK